MNRSYTKEQRRRALQVYKRTQSVTKTVRELGYPGRWTLYKWLREPAKPGRPRKQSRTLSRYPFEVKLRAVELFHAGWRPADIAVECELRSKMSVYSWAQRHREEGEWGLMSKRERKEHTCMPTRAALEKSLADDPAELKKQMAQLLVDKAVLEKELELVKKDVSVIPGQLSNKHKAEVVDALRGEFPLSMLLAAIDLAASSFYYQLQQRFAPDKHAHIREMLHEISSESNNTYGYRRLWWELRHRGIVISEKVVRRLMHEEGIHPWFPKRKWRYSSYQGEISSAPPNLVNRNFHAEHPNRLWLTDISVFATNQGRVYLSAIIDCFDGKVVAAKTSVHPTMELAEETLYAAIATEKPAMDGSLVIHSDRGAHYRGSSWRSMTEKFGILRSMSKKGCSPDNAACEGFFGRMKNEMYYGRTWQNPQELEEAIATYIEFYNNHRIKISLDGLSITEYRKVNVA